VGKTYVEGTRSRAVLHGVDLAILEGEVVAICGRSGSGKTTLLNLLAGLDRPSEGRVEVAGLCVNEASDKERTLFRRDQVGFVFQFFNLVPTLTVLENVQLPAELGGRPPAEAAARAKALLARVGLEDRAEAFPDALSGGEQQRTAIARALVRDPRLVLADEPTGNLDDDTGGTVLDLLIQSTRGQGKTLVLVTHSREVARRADRVFTIDHGHLAPLAG
jgi:putative ABC transport system ATP-binding protein